jgi:hypothetical protein
MSSKEWERVVNPTRVERYLRQKAQTAAQYGLNETYRIEAGVELRHLIAATQPKAFEPEIWLAFIGHGHYGRPKATNPVTYRFYYGRESEK